MTLLPPSTSTLMRQGHDIKTNRSSIKAGVVHSSLLDGTPGPSPDNPLVLEVDADEDTASAIAKHAMVGILREGETLFIPDGWWHRVENVCLVPERQPTAGWTAAVSWWFLPRSKHTVIRQPMSPCESCGLVLRANILMGG